MKKHGSATWQQYAEQTFDLWFVQSIIDIGVIVAEKQSGQFLSADGRMDISAYGALNGMSFVLKLMNNPHPTPTKGQKNKVVTEWKHLTFLGHTFYHLRNQGCVLSNERMDGVISKVQRYFI